MTPTEEQKKVAEKIVSDFHARKNTGLTQLEQDIAQALQAVAENAARAVRDSVLEKSTCALAIDSGEDGFCECCDDRMCAATTAAAPFLKNESNGGHAD